MSILSDHLNQLSTQDKQRLREKLLNQLCSNNLARDTTRLSHAQERLWIVEQLSSCKYLYHVPVVVELPRALSLDALQVALNCVLRENPVLFSAFEFKEERVVLHQRMQDVFIDDITLTDDLPHVFDVTQVPFFAEFFLKAFDLGKAPLFRMCILKTPSQRFLVGCFHHLIIDGWSVNLFVHRLQEQCELRQIDQMRENKLDRDYFSYVAWEKTQTVAEGLVAYWQNRLLNKPWVVDLVTDYPRQAGQSNQGYTLHHKVSSTTLAWLDSQAGISVNHMVLFAFQFMLARYSGQSDITLGMPISGRIHERWQETIGLFVNTLIHTCDIAYTRSVQEQLYHLKETLLADLAHSEIPFDVLVKTLYKEKLIHQTALFNVLYNFIPIEQFSHTERNLWPMHYCTLPVSKFDLSLHVYADLSHVDLFLEFSNDLFDERTIKQMLQYLLVVLENLPLYFDKSLQQLNLACFNQIELGSHHES